MLEISAEELVIGPLRILPEEHLVRAGGRVLMLSARELAVLTDLPEWRFIHTHFGFGYRLSAERVGDQGLTTQSQSS